MRPALARRNDLLTALLAVAGALACGDDHSEKRAEQATTEVPVSAAAEGRLVVAEVNGKPVYGDCVATQMEGDEVDRQTALQQCVDFELLAQRAAERGYGSNPEVLETQRREAVRAFIDDVFLPTFDGPEDVPEAAVRAQWKTNRFDYDYPEYRFTAHLLVRVSKRVPPGSKKDLAARKVAEAFYRHFRDERWDMDEFLDEARRLRADHVLAQLYAGLEPLAAAEEPPTLDRVLDVLALSVSQPDVGIQALPKGFPAGGGGRYVRVFADAAFAIPEVGMVSPPVRSKSYGWHVILLTKLLPAQHDTFADAEPKIREQLFFHERQRAFVRWESSIVDGDKIEIDDKALARMVAAERARDPLRGLNESPK